MKVFMSYYSDEKGIAEEISEHLKSTFRSSGLEVFMASSWDSLALGDKWEEKIIKSLQETDALLVLMSWDALTRPWINFEIGVAWARNVRILIFCHKGMNLSALPRPYGSLQAEDLNGLNDAQRNQRVADAVARTLNIKPSLEEVSADLSVPEREESFFLTNRRWSLRPVGHLGETAWGRFLVGVVRPAHPDKALAAGLEPGEALYVRLFMGTAPETPYINAMVSGKAANYFEKIPRDTVLIDAKVRLAGALKEEDGAAPLLVIDEYTAVKSPK